MVFVKVLKVTRVMFPKFTCFINEEIAITRVIFCQPDADSFKMSDAKVVSVMYEEGANEVQGLSTVILWKTQCSFISVFPKDSAFLHKFTAPWYIIVIELAVLAVSPLPGCQLGTSRSAQLQLSPWALLMGR